MNPAPRFRPTVVRLEDRTTPAGNVTAQVIGGVLFIQGDAQDNSIQVAKTGERSVIIRSLDGTTVNGRSEPQWFGDIKRGYDIKLGAGDDTVEVIGVKAKRGLRVEGEAGADQITLTGVESKRETDILGGGGNDVITLTDGRFRGRTAIDLGAGDDRLTLVGNRTDENTFLQGGDGNDTVNWVRNRFDTTPDTLNFETRSAALPPTAVNDSAEVAPGGSVRINVAANDRAGRDALVPSSVVVTETPNSGTVATNADGTVTFTAGDAGTATFRYTIQDANGLVSNEATVTVRVTGTDARRPGASIRSSAATNPTAQAPIPFVVTFTEAVSGFDASDVVVTNGTVANFTATGPSTFTFGVVPAGDGEVTVNVPEGAAVDAAGNTSTAADTASVISIRTDAGMVNSVPDVNAAEWVTQAGGLKVWDTVVGTGPGAVAAQSTITVFYSGWLTNGTLFDSARATGSPATFALTNLIQGWQQGLIGMKPGGIRRLFVPAALGYGANGSPPNIPGNADLVFEIKLVAVS